jgi:hypothetical protein
MNGLLSGILKKSMLTSNAVLRSISSTSMCRLKEGNKLLISYFQYFFLNAIVYNFQSK